MLIKNLDGSHQRPHSTSLDRKRTTKILCLVIQRPDEDNMELESQCYMATRQYHQINV